MCVKARKRLAALILWAGVSTAGWGQVITLQPENHAGSLIATAGLPTLGLSGVWNGYASCDSMPIVAAQGSYGFGISNGNWFDAGAAITLKKRMTLIGWTSGMTSRLNDIDIRTSTLQRGTQLGTQYRFGYFAIYGGVNIQTLTINSNLTARTVAPVLSAEYALAKSSRIGLRLANFTFNPMLIDGTIQQDSTVLNPSVQISRKGPADMQLYVSDRYGYRRFSAGIMAGGAVAFNTRKEFLLAGGPHAGIGLQGALRLGYANKVFLSIGDRFSQAAKLSQVTFGLSVKIQQLTLNYSSFNFTNSDRYRAHIVGLAVAIQ